MTDGEIKIEFVPTDANVEDIFTKNIKAEVNDRHSQGLVGQRDDTIGGLDSKLYYSGRVSECE